MHDKIGHVAKFLVSMLERYGDVDSRAFTAFMFFEVLLRHLKTPKTLKNSSAESKFKKPHTAATRYLNLYAASDIEDAQGKDPALVSMILNRSLMWDASKVPGCQSCYAFKTGKFDYRARNGVVSLKNFIFRKYPCPFGHCACMRSHIDIVMDNAMPMPCCDDDNMLLPDPWSFKTASIKKKPAVGARADRGDDVAIEGDEEDEGAELLSQELEAHLRDVLSEANFIMPVL